MYFNIYIYIYTYSYVDHDYDVDFHVTMLLRSTTGTYGRPVWEDDTFTPPRLYDR